MSLSRRDIIAGSAGAAAFGALPYQGARAQGGPTIKIGVLNDMSGMYRDISGMSAVACVRAPVQESAGRGINIEVLAADHQNRPDVGVNIARQWIYRDGVDVLLDVTTSSVAPSVAEIFREKNNVHLNSSHASNAHNGALSKPNTWPVPI